MSSNPPLKPPKPSSATVDALLARFGHNLVQAPIAGFATSSGAETSLTAKKDSNRRVAVVSVKNRPGSMPALGAVEIGDPPHDGNNVFAVLLGSPKGVRMPDFGLERVGVDISNASFRSALESEPVARGQERVETLKLPGAGWVTSDRQPTMETRIAILAPTSFDSSASGTVFGDWEMIVVTLASIAVSDTDPAGWTPQNVYTTSRKADLLRQPTQEDYAGRWPIVVVCSTVREDREGGAVFVG